MLRQIRSARFRAACREAREEPLANVVDRVAETLGAGPHRDFNRFMSQIRAEQVVDIAVSRSQIGYRVESMKVFRAD